MLGAILPGKIADKQIQVQSTHTQCCNTQWESQIDNNNPQKEKKQKKEIEKVKKRVVAGKDIFTFLQTREGWMSVFASTVAAL